VKVTGKTEEQLIKELERMRQRLAELEASEAGRKQAEEALRESEEFKSSLLDASPILILVSRPDTSIIYANPAMEKLTGFTAAELVGKKAPFPWWIADERSGNTSELVKNISTGVRGLEKVFQKKNGELFWVEITSIPVIRDGELQYSITNFVDITERKQAEEALRRERDKAQRYLDVAGVILVAIDADQKVSLVNKRGCEVLGYEEKDIIGKNWFDNFLPGGVGEGVKTVFGELMAGKVTQEEYFENPVLSRDGAEKIIVWHNVVLKDETGSIVGTLSSGEDVTERRQAERKVVEYEELNKMKSDLLSTVSHELRTPLATIKGYSTMIIDYYNRLGDDEKKEYLKAIDRSTVRLTKMIDNLLDMSRTGSGPAREVTQVKH